MDTNFLGPNGKIELIPVIGFTNLSQAINTFITAAIFFGALAAFLFILLGAFKYILAGDKPDGTKAARTTMVNAIVGLVLLGLVMVIFQFVIRLVPGLHQYFSVGP